MQTETMSARSFLATCFAVAVFVWGLLAWFLSTRFCAQGVWWTLKWSAKAIAFHNSPAKVACWTESSDELDCKENATSLNHFVQVFDDFCSAILCRTGFAIWWDSQWSCEIHAEPELKTGATCRTGARSNEFAFDPTLCRSGSKARWIHDRIEFRSEAARQIWMNRNQATSQLNKKHLETFFNPS